MKLEAGMTFTTEPMINQGDYRLKHMKDGWTVTTRDKNCRPNGNTPLLLRRQVMKYLLCATKNKTRRFNGHCKLPLITPTHGFALYSPCGHAIFCQ